MTCQGRRNRRQPSRLDGREASPGCADGRIGADAGCSLPGRDRPWRPPGHQSLPCRPPHGRHGLRGLRRFIQGRRATGRPTFGVQEYGSAVPTPQDDSRQDVFLPVSGPPTFMSVLMSKSISATAGRSTFARQAMLPSFAAVPKRPHLPGRNASSVEE